YDNRLAVDLENVLSVEAFTHALKKRDSAMLEETFLASEDEPVEGPDGHYAHEIVVPIARPVTSAVRVPSAETGDRPAGTAFVLTRLCMALDKALLRRVDRRRDPHRGHRTPHPSIAGRRRRQGLVLHPL